MYIKIAPKIPKYSPNCAYPIKLIKTNFLFNIHILFQMLNGNTIMKAFINNICIETIGLFGQSLDDNLKQWNRKIHFDHRTDKT